jgi:hypothetical protein
MVPKSAILAIDYRCAASVPLQSRQSGLPCAGAHGRRRLHPRLLTSAICLGFLLWRSWLYGTFDPGIAVSPKDFSTLDFDFMLIRGTSVFQFP